MPESNYTGPIGSNQTVYTTAPTTMVGSSFLGPARSYMGEPPTLSFEDLSASPDDQQKILSQRRWMWLADELARLKYGLERQEATQVARWQLICSLLVLMGFGMAVVFILVLVLIFRG